METRADLVYYFDSAFNCQGLSADDASDNFIADFIKT